MINKFNLIDFTPDEETGNLKSAGEALVVSINNQGIVMPVPRDPDVQGIFMLPYVQPNLPPPKGAIDVRHLFFHPIITDGYQYRRVYPRVQEFPEKKRMDYFVKADPNAFQVVGLPYVGASFGLRPPKNNNQKTYLVDHAGGRFIFFNPAVRGDLELTMKDRELIRTSIKETAKKQGW